MTFVSYDEVKHFQRNIAVVLHRRRCMAKIFLSESSRFFLFRLKFFTLQHGIKALDGGNANLADRIKLVGLHVLNVVKLGEWTLLIRGFESLKLFERLTAQIVAIYQKENAFGPAMF